MASNPLDFDAPNPYAEPQGARAAAPPRRGLGCSVLPILLVLGVGLGGGYAYLQARNATVWFVNGLDVAVTATVGGATVELQPRSRDSVSIAPGEYEVVVAGPDGVERERESVVVPGFTDVVAYNVAGAAPLYATSVTYRSINVGMASEQREDYAGQTFITRDGVTYLFEEPPQTVSVSGSATSAVYWQFTDGPDPGWLVALNTLRNTRGLEAARALLERVQAYDPTNPTVPGMRVALGMDSPNRGAPAPMGAPSPGGVTPTPTPVPVQGQPLGPNGRPLSVQPSQPPLGPNGRPLSVQPRGGVVGGPAGGAGAAGGGGGGK